MELTSVFILQREWFWNDIDHTSGLSVIDVFTTEPLAKQAAQDIYIAENPNRIFDTLEWSVDKELPDTAITNLHFDEYKAEHGNFWVQEFVVKGKPNATT